MKDLFWKLYEEIKHGDEEHQLWLKNKIADFIEGQPKEELMISGSITKEQRHRLADWLMRSVPSIPMCNLDLAINQIVDRLSTPTDVRSMDEIVTAIQKSFKTFGGEDLGDNYKNPIASAMEGKPLIFALGVDVTEVVQFILKFNGQQTAPITQELAEARREIERLNQELQFYKSHTDNFISTLEKIAGVD